MKRKQSKGCGTKVYYDEFHKWQLYCGDKAIDGNIMFCSKCSEKHKKR